MPGMWGYYDNSGMWVWAMLQTVFLLALVGVAVWAVVRLLNRPTHSTPPPYPPNPPYPPQQLLSALDILQQRYARGEIDAATFEQMRERLESSPSARHLVGTP